MHHHKDRYECPEPGDAPTDELHRGGAGRWIAGCVGILAGLAEPFTAQIVLHQPQPHADGGGAEAPVPARIRIETLRLKQVAPALVLRQETTDQRGQECADIDAHIKDRKAGVA